MSAEYGESFLSFIRSGGKHAASGLNEGFDSLFGGFALPALPGRSAAAYEGGASTGAAAVSQFPRSEYRGPWVFQILA